MTKDIQISKKYALSYSVEDKEDSYSCVLLIQCSEDRLLAVSDDIMKTKFGKYERWTDGLYRKGDKKLRLERFREVTDEEFRILQKFYNEA